MFERRLKVFLFLLAGVVLVLLGRAGWVQIIHRDYWRGEAVKAMTRPHLISTTRGKIYDRNGQLLAEDSPCVDACIDFRALGIEPDPDWMKEKALERLHARYGDAWVKLPSKQRAALRATEERAVRDDIKSMWGRLAAASGRPEEEIEEARQAIVHRVEMRQRFVWYSRYQAALDQGKDKKGDAAGWKKWITEGGSDAPAVDNFQITVSEQVEPHVILQAIEANVQNIIGKDIEKYPGLVLRPGTHRYYPYDDVACHLLGHVARVNAENLKHNKTLDELRAYMPNDLVGAGGVEWLCEPALRGTRGKEDRLENQTVLAKLAPVPGAPVTLTIDIDLQQRIQTAFASATLRGANGVADEENAVLHGAAVVLDVKSNEVLALVSYPTYNLNRFDDLYASLLNDDINNPLRNRATFSELEPGSTVKPLCGLAGIAQGVVGVNQGIECTGYLELDGHRVGYGRCWVASKFEKVLKDNGMSVAHHPIPSSSPHRGHDGNLDGYLTYSDALERSCNIYFETVADRLGIDRLSEWYSTFGLGRPTGLGLWEASGRLPSSFPKTAPGARRRIIGFSGGIGQGYIAATPIQMANAAAMIARDGIWMRPRLLLPGSDGKLPAVRPGSWQNTPDRVDLHLPPEALKAAHLGMYNVVNGAAGTGKAVAAGDKLLQDLHIAGKTGTAQASRFAVPMRDPFGHPVLNEKGKQKYRILEPSTAAQPNAEAPWYRAADAEGKELNHAWYIGFVPVEKPKIAFAVMVEYGGSGGVAAASVAREAIEACVGRGYIDKPAPAPSENLALRASR